MRTTDILSELRDLLCLPVLRQCESEATATQRAALLFAPLIVIPTGSPQVQVFAFTDGRAVECGRYALPPAGGDALADFFNHGLNEAMSADVRATVAQLLTEGVAQLVAWIRPDRGEAAAYLVMRDTSVHLFSLVAGAEVTH